MTKQAHIPIWQCLLAASFVLFVGCDGHELVIDDLAQKDAHIALVLLRDQNIEAHKESHPGKKGTTYGIRVKKSQTDAALRILVENHFPNEERVSLKNIYSPGMSGLIPSKVDELGRLVMALQGEAEALLKVVPGIIDARVVFSLEPPLDFKYHPTKKTASVIVLNQASPDNLNSVLSDQQIKDLIAASQSGMSPEDVIVVQKMIKQSIPDQKSKAKAKIIDQDQHGNKFHWWMLLTALALLVAGYGMFRLVIEKRA